MILYCEICEEETEHNILDHCICNEDCGGGYTFSDEFGNCGYCLGKPAICTECNNERELD
jgi:hypothetical protein